MEKKNENILFKNVDLIIVYLVIFAVGLAIVFGMTSFLNNKVKEFTDISSNTEKQ